MFLLQLCTHVSSADSFVSSVNYVQETFFNQLTMASVRIALASSREFMSMTPFNSWEDVCCGNHDDFTVVYSVAFAARLAQMKKEVDKRAYEPGRTGQDSFSSTGNSVSSCSESRVSTTEFPSSHFALGLPSSVTVLGGSGSLNRGEKLLVVR